MSTPIFKFDMGALMEIIVSGERGTVIGRVEYHNMEPSYQLRYKRADGSASESWWDESAIQPVE